MSYAYNVRLHILPSLERARDAYNIVLRHGFRYHANDALLHLQPESEGRAVDSGPLVLTCVVHVGPRRVGGVDADVRECDWEPDGYVLPVAQVLLAQVSFCDDHVCGEVQDGGFCV